MSQFLAQVPRQALLQQQRLTPQLIQAMDILQLGTLALESRLADEVDRNPALEFAPDETDTAASPEKEPPVSTADGDRPLVVDDDGSAGFERLDTLLEEYDWLDEEGYRDRGFRVRDADEVDGKLDALANAAARPDSLQEYLLAQWQLADVDDRVRALGRAIIESLDDGGRLNTPLDELASAVEPPADGAELERALAAVQRLDPPGVAARSLQECLLLQLAALPGDNTLERRILTEHFENLQRNRLPAIARALNVDLAEVKAALRVIGRLSLHPGSDVIDRVAPPIVPDVIVEYNADEDRYEVRLSRPAQRELRISPEFRELLEAARHDKRARDFARQKIEEANAIIDAVRFRRERLLEVARAVVEAQRDFLDHGEQHLKVLRMSDLAARFGCDPSTISRTVDEKYMQTPRGIYPLRYFFTGGAETDDGDALGWASIRAKVAEIIAREDKRNPLNDDEIVARLRAEGIDIKRRTVAKYRAQLGIPSARQRIQY